MATGIGARSRTRRPPAAPTLRCKSTRHSTRVRDRPDGAADPGERGFKDTVKANPGYFTTVRAKFELPAGVTAPQSYVYHCHIVEHEDNDMMRPFTVTP